VPLPAVVLGRRELQSDTPFFRWHPAGISCGGNLFFTHEAMGWSLQCLRFCLRIGGSRFFDPVVCSFWVLGFISLFPANPLWGCSPPCFPILFSFSFPAPFSLTGPRFWSCGVSCGRDGVFVFVEQVESLPLPFFHGFPPFKYFSPQPTTARLPFKFFLPLVLKRSVLGFFSDGSASHALAPRPPLHLPKH